MRAFSKYFIPCTAAGGAAYQTMLAIEEVNGEKEYYYRFTDAQRVRNIMATRILIGVMTGCVLGPIAVITSPITLPLYFYEKYVKKD